MQKWIGLMLVAGVSALFFGCGGSGDERKSERKGLAPPSGAIAAESLSPDGCLNVPAYFKAILALEANTSVLEISTHFSYQSKKPVRDKFGGLMAYTTFHAGSRALRDFSEFSGLSQDGCKGLLAHSAGGPIEVFPLILASPLSIRAESSDGRAFQYSWVSPTRMIIDLNYHAYDLPCGNSEPVLLRQRRVLDWSGVSIESIDLGAEPFGIDPTYLGKVAEAVGIPASSLFLESKIIPAKLSEMAGLPLMPELLSCQDSPSPEHPGGEPETPTVP